MADSADHDYVAPASQSPAVEHRIVAGSGGVPAAMNRKQDSPLAAVLQARGPDVQHEAVFASSAGQCRPLDREGVVIVAAGQGLRCDLAPFERVARAIQRLFRRQAADHDWRSALQLLEQLQERRRRAEFEEQQLAELAARRQAPPTALSDSRVRFDGQPLRAPQPAPLPVDTPVNPVVARLPDRIPMFRRRGVARLQREGRRRDTGSWYTSCK